VFQYLHTLKALESAPPAQFLVMNALLAVLLLFLLAGTVQAVAVPRRSRIPQADRRWHRRFALLLYPLLLAFTTSGVYHLWHTHFDTTVRGQRLLLTLADTSSVVAPPALPESSALDAASLVETRAGHRYWRLSLPGGAAGVPMSRSHHFDGTARESGGIYLPLEQQAPALDDRAYAEDLARRVLGADTPILSLDPVRSFGPDYDFRNKRLPVWRVVTPEERLFVDPASGVLVERVTRATLLEALSFGTLHKWNPLVPLIGRNLRDALVVTVLGACMALAALGGTMKWRRARRARPLSAPTPVTTDIVT
jgi:hypothetical protein